MKRKIVATFFGLACMLTLQLLQSAAHHIIAMTESRCASLREQSIAEQTSAVDQALKKFLHDKYNTRLFHETLMHNGNDLLVILSTLKQLNLGESGTEYAYTTCKLFADKLTACEYVDHTVIEHILGSLPHLMTHYFRAEPYSAKDISVLVAEVLAHVLAPGVGSSKNASPTHKELPNTTALETVLAAKITSKIEDALDAAYAQWRLRSAMLRLVEMMVGKTMWSQAHFESIWPSFLKIAQQLTHLHRAGLIDHRDDLNSIQWSLVNRFCYFLSISGAVFPLNFYEHIASDVKNGLVPFLFDEVDAVRSKAEVLIDTLHLAVCASRAFHEVGIVAPGVA